MEQTMYNMTQDGKSRSNKTFWIMVILFGLPYILAWLFYFNVDNMEFGTKTNYGTLVSPVRKIPDVALTTIDSNEFQMSSLKDKWIIVTIGNTSCESDCQNNIYKMRQIRKALGENMFRVERLFLLSDTTNIASFNKLLTDYDGMHVVTGEGDQFISLISLFSYDGQPPEDGIYIIDPLGNFMMSYPKDADAKFILKDIERLLKVSKIG